MDTWKVHIFNKVVNDIADQTKAAGRYETGGYLIGQCNLKTNTIHVIDTIEAPEDTIHRGDYLVLGKAGIRKNYLRSNVELEERLDMWENGIRTLTDLANLVLQILKSLLIKRKK